MIFRRATIKDLSAILSIINDAKQLLAKNNIDQWQNGYPNQGQIENDIAQQQSYVVITDANTIVGTTMFTTNKEPTYKHITNGQWLVEETAPYGVIHRLATSATHRNLGIAKFMFNECHKRLKKEGIKSLKIDTHEANLGMQSLIKSLGYSYRGVIYTSYNAKRIAFEIVL